MAFDKRYYNEVKKFVALDITYDPTRMLTHLNMIDDLLAGDDFEAVLATFDAIEDFIIHHEPHDEDRDYIDPVSGQDPAPFEYL